MTIKGQNLTAQPSSSRWAKVASAVSLALALPAAQAAGISWGEWEGSFDSTISIGASWRVENIDLRLVGRGQQTDRGVGTAFSFNGDDGNLNFHKGDSFSEVIKGVHDFGLEHSSGFGFFVRGAWLYDQKLKDGNFRYYGTSDVPTPAFTNNPLVNGFSDKALARQGSDARILDAYIYNTWYFGDSALQIRIGEQVVNWGESTFIQHSISEANPIDVTKLRVPGAELKEAFIPIQTLWASFDLSENVSLESYVQFEWEPVVIDEPGTYFSTTDFVGESGEPLAPGETGSNIWLGFTRLGPEYTPGTSAGRLASREASDSGQFGLKLAWYLPDFGDTELGFYYLNYHNRRPVISTFAHDGQSIKGFFEYLEDIQLVGASFNTATDAGLSIAGEVSYRMDEPLQIDDVEVLFAAFQSLDGAVVADGTSQIPADPAPGDEISGYRLFDTIQGQFTITNLFGPTFGASQLVGLVEVGFNQIQDMPDQDVLRFEAPGTRRSGNPLRDVPGLEGLTDNSFADDFSWGYRLVLKADYLGAFGSWNASPRLVFQHDVSGTTPAPISNFVEDRKALALGVTFDYLQKWRIDFGYNSFFDGGTANLLSDRDFVALTAGYSF